MNDTFFYGLDGALQGKVPVQLVIQGEGDPELVRAEANSALRAFLDTVRLGQLAHLRRTVQLRGGSLQLIHTQGVTRALLTVVGGGSSRPAPFYGGILISPHVCSATHVSPVTWPTLSTPLPITMTSGRTETSPGRPGVPGAVEGETDWLVVQISPSATLGPESVARRDVKFLRIASPKFGGHPALAAAGQYIASTRDGSEFYICGRKMVRVPPMPVYPPELYAVVPTISRVSSSWDATYARVLCLDLDVPSFEAAADSHALLICATQRRLHVLDTRAETPAWQLLAERTGAPDSFADFQFAAEFTDTRVGAVRTVRCAGTSPLGPLSGFEVVIDYASDPPAMSGVLTVADSGARVHAVAVRTIRTGLYELAPQAVHVDSHTFGHVKYPPIGDDTAEDLTGGAVAYVEYQRHVSYQAIGFRSTINTEITRSTTVPGVAVDKFLGIPGDPQPTVSSRRFVTSTVDATDFQGYHYRIKGWGYFDIYTGTGPTAVLVGTAAVDNNAYYYTPFGGAYVETSSALYMTVAEANSYYGGSVFDILSVTPATVGVNYRMTFEYSGYYSSYRRGPQSQTQAAIGLTPGVSTAGYRVWGVLDLDSEANRFDYPYARPPVINSLPPETPPTGLVYDVTPIMRYPKRAAVFGVTETWTYEETGDTLASGEASRTGYVVADEHSARALPTNVSSFPRPLRADITAHSRTGAEDPAPFERALDTGWAAEYESITPPYTDHTSSLALYVDSSVTGTDQAPPGSPSYPVTARYLEFVGAALLRRITVASAAIRFRLRISSGATVLERAYTNAELESTLPSPITQVLSLLPQNSRAELAYDGLDYSVIDFNGRHVSGYVGLLDRSYGYASPTPTSSYAGYVRPVLNVGYGNRFDPPADPPPSGIPPIPAEGVPLAYDRLEMRGVGHPQTRAGQTAPNAFNTTDYDIQQLVLFDERTGGFIAQIAVGPKLHTELVIGNRNGTTPLRPLLEAWAALGGDELPPGQITLHPPSLSPPFVSPLCDPNTLL